MNNSTRSAETTKTIGTPLESESVSRAVVEAVADEEGVSPIDVYPPLYDAIDPDALEQFVSSIAPTATGVHVTFTYAGYEVTVTGNGDVSLEAE